MNTNPKYNNHNNHKNTWLVLDIIDIVINTLDYIIVGIPTLIVIGIIHIIYYPFSD